MARPRLERFMLIDPILPVFRMPSGVTTVLFGFGGFVTVPPPYSALTAVRGDAAGPGSAAMHVAVATSTAVVVGSPVATVRHARPGNLVAAELPPLAGYVAVGAGLGAALATGASDGPMRRAFVACLGVTILDRLLRRGFLFLRQGVATLRRMPPLFTAAAGLVIGAIASFPGVGGSVMTVPMMRRRGMDMTRAAAMANPLALPVALVGAGFYMLSRPGITVSSRWQVGGVDGLAFVILVVGSLPGIRAGSPFIGRIPDAWHARTCILPLGVVLLSMAVRRLAGEAACPAGGPSLRASRRR